MKDIVIFGSKAFADVAHYYFTHDSDHSVAAFTVDGEYLRESTCNGLPVVPFEEIEGKFPPSEFGMFVAVGIQRVNSARAAKVAEAEKRGYQLVSFLSSKADAHDVILRPNTMIMERAVIQPFVEIGRDTIIWSASRIAFRTHIGEHCWIVGPIVGESCSIGDYTFIGLNATVAPGLSIGKSNIIGAGALIMSDSDDYAVFRGSASKPAKIPSTRLWR